MTIAFSNIKDSFFDLLINMSTTEPDMLTPEQKHQIQVWYAQNLQKQVQRLTADYKGLVA
jgi:hypothetical protein